MAGLFAMTMISYAQNREDVLLQRIFPEGPGFYIDIGANDPVESSVTRHFYDRGWCGINVEPVTEVCRRLSEQRPRDVNLNVGVSERCGTRTLFEFPTVSVLSTFCREEAERHRMRGNDYLEREVSVTTLAQICEDHVDGTIEFLSVDVEGHEHEVLRGGNWQCWRPRVVVVEATRPNSTIPTFQEWEAVLLDADYLFGHFDGLNRFYVRAEDRGLLPALNAPANVFDGFVPHEYLKQIADLHQQLHSAHQLILRLKRQLDAERSTAPGL